jgi:MTH538 TIR-like domain (DUF1863)
MNPNDRQRQVFIDALYGRINPAPPDPRQALLRQMAQMPRKVKPKVFVSFDFENDVHYKRLLEAWSANTRFQFTFQDKTPQEIQSEDIGRIKAGLTLKLKEATHVLVIVGRYANQWHHDHAKIGHRNWINFEVYQGKQFNKKLVAVKLHPSYLLPDEVANAASGWLVEGFNQANIIAALNKG